MHKLPIILFCFLFLASTSLAQETVFCSYAEEHHVNELCDFYAQSSFERDIDAEAAIDRILSPIGLPRNFVIAPCRNVPNAVAAFPADRVRYILYNPEFMTRAGQASEWAALSILSHEVAHHLMGHTLKKEGDIKLRHQQELEADEHSGFILFKLGASLFEAQAAIIAISDDFDDRYSSHPSRYKRLAAIERGYRKAGEENHLNDIYITPKEKNSSPLDGVFITERPENQIEISFNEGKDLFEKGFADFKVIDRSLNEEAIQKFTAVIKQNNNHALAYAYRGYAYYRLDSLEHAMDDCNTSIALNSNLAIAYHARALIHLLNGNYKKSIEDNNRAIKQEPNSPQLYNNRGFAKHKLKDFNGAISDYTKAIQLNPRDATAYNNRGISKNDLTDYQDAIKDYTKAIKIDSEYTDAYFNRGYAKYKLQDYKGAIADYTKAIQLNPQLTAAYNNRGLAKYCLKDYKGANYDYAKAIELDSEYTLAHLNTLIGYLMSGNNRSFACTVFKKACDSDNDIGCLLYATNCE